MKARTPWPLVSTLALVLTATGPSAGGAATSSDIQRSVIDRLRAREAVLAEHWAASSAVSRHQAWAAYRLARKRQVGFLTNPRHRRADAEAVGLALSIVRRSLREARLNKEELERVRGEREALEATLHRRAEKRPDVAGLEPAEAAGTTGPFRSPVAGPIVGAPGLRRDPATGAQLRRIGVQILARLNDPVRAVRRGAVRRVARLPQGGFGVVTEHPDGWISVLTGLREVSVAEGQPVEGGQVLGLAGRTLDGASVVAYELWHDRAPVDPRSAR